MSNVNVGAVQSNGAFFKSKKALREQVAADPSTVGVHATSIFNQSFDCATVADLPEGTTLTVVGPDPYNDRRWYANVTQKGGKFKVA